MVPALSVFKLPWAFRWYAISKDMLKNLLVVNTI